MRPRSGAWDPRPTATGNATAARTFRRLLVGSVCSIGGADGFRAHRLVPRVRRKKRDGARASGRVVSASALLSEHNKNAIAYGLKDLLLCLVSRCDFAMRTKSGALLAQRLNNAPRSDKESNPMSTQVGDSCDGQPRRLERELSELAYCKTLAYTAAEQKQPPPWPLVL